MASSGPPFVYIWFKVDQYFLKLDKTLTEFSTCLLQKNSQKHSQICGSPVLYRQCFATNKGEENNGLEAFCRSTWVYNLYPLVKVSDFWKFFVYTDG